MKPQPRYRPGDKIGSRYQVYQALMGGMGEVHLCLDLETNLRFALKTFQQRYLTNPKLRRAFEQEVATWVTLEKRPNIVRCEVGALQFWGRFYPLGNLEDRKVGGASNSQSSQLPTFPGLPL